MTPSDSQLLTAAVGARVTALRVERGWSLSTLAARAGLGKATLSAVEAGRRNPTLETLFSIAAQFDVPLTELLTDVRGAGVAGIVGGAEPPRLSGDAVTATLVETFVEPSMTIELYRLAIRPGVVQTSPGHGPGVTEHLLVTAGLVRVGPVGKPLTGSAGDNLTWESSTEHTYCALGTDPAQAILLMRYPRAPSPQFSPPPVPTNG